MPTDIILAVKGAARSNMACNMLLRRMGRAGVTTHGFRSTFRDWAGDERPHAREVIEQALAHTISNKAEAAYRRGTALEKRRTLMSDWAAFLKPRNVVARDNEPAVDAAAALGKSDEEVP